MVWIERMNSNEHPRRILPTLKRGTQQSIQSAKEMGKSIVHNSRLVTLVDLCFMLYATLMKGELCRMKVYAYMK